MEPLRGTLKLTRKLAIGYEARPSDQAVGITEVEAWFVGKKAQSRYGVETSKRFGSKAELKRAIEQNIESLCVSCSRTCLATGHEKVLRACINPFLLSISAGEGVMPDDDLGRQGAGQTTLLLTPMVPPSPGDNTQARSRGSGALDLLNYLFARGGTYRLASATYRDQEGDRDAFAQRLTRRMACSLSWGELEVNPPAKLVEFGKTLADRQVMDDLRKPRLLSASSFLVHHVCSLALGLLEQQQEAAGRRSQASELLDRAWRLTDLVCQRLCQKQPTICIDCVPPPLDQRDLALCANLEDLLWKPEHHLIPDDVLQVHLARAQKKANGGRQYTDEFAGDVLGNLQAASVKRFKRTCRWYCLREICERSDSGERIRSGLDVFHKESMNHAPQRGAGAGVKRWLGVPQKQVHPLNEKGKMQEPDQSLVALCHAASNGLGVKGAACPLETLPRCDADTFASASGLLKELEEVKLARQYLETFSPHQVEELTKLVLAEERNLQHALRAINTLETSEEESRDAVKTCRYEIELCRRDTGQRLEDAAALVSRRGARDPMRSVLADYGRRCGWLAEAEGALQRQLDGAQGSVEEMARGSRKGLRAAQRKLDTLLRLLSAEEDWRKLRDTVSSLRAVTRNNVCTGKVPACGAPHFGRIQFAKLYSTVLEPIRERFILPEDLLWHLWLDPDDHPGGGDAGGGPMPPKLPGARFITYCAAVLNDLLGEGQMDQCLTLVLQLYSLDPETHDLVPHCEVPDSFPSFDEHLDRSVRSNTTRWRDRDRSACWDALFDTGSGPGVPRKVIANFEGLLGQWHRFFNEEELAELGIHLGNDALVDGILGHHEGEDGDHND